MSKRGIVVATAVSSAMLLTAFQGSAFAAKPSSKVSTVDYYGFKTPIAVNAVRAEDTTLTMNNGQTWTNNVWEKLYNKSGIHINYEWTTDTTHYTDKLNVMLASGSLPDMMVVNAVQLKQLADEGQLADLSSAYQKYATSVTKRAESGDGGEALKSATFNGQLLGLPLQNGYPMWSSQVLWVRTDWLKKLHLPAPKTMADVARIAKAFATEDPNGDGKNDTYGLAIDKNLVDAVPDYTGFMNGYHAYPGIWIKNSSGHLVYGSVQPQMKAGLASLAKMYKAGQIDTQFAVEDSNQVATSVDSGKLGMFYGAWWSPTWPLQDGKKLDPKMTWKAYPIPSSTNQPAKTQLPFNVNGYLVIRKGYAHPELAPIMFNLYYEMAPPQASYAQNNKYGQDAAGNQMYKFAFFETSDPTYDNGRADIIKAVDSHNSSKLDPREKQFYNQIVADQSGKGNVDDWVSDGMYGNWSAYPVFNDYLKNHLVEQNQFYGAPTPTMVSKWTALQLLETQTFTKIIMGDAPLSSFNTFVANWNKLGGAQITQEVNRWYATQK